METVWLHYSVENILFYIIAIVYYKLLQYTNVNFFCFRHLSNFEIILFLHRVHNMSYIARNLFNLSATFM